MPDFYSDASRCAELLNGIVGGTGDRIAALDTDYRFVCFNEAYRRDFEQRFGHPPAIGASFLELVCDRACALATFGRAFRGEAYTVEEAIGPASNRLWYEIEVFPLPGEGGVIAGAVHIARDITARKQAERALLEFRQDLERQIAERTQEAREGHSLLHRVLDGIFAFVAVLEPDGTLIEVNSGPLELAGIKADDVIGRKFWDCVWWSHTEGVAARIRSDCEGAGRGEVIRYDAGVTVAGGARVMFDYMIAPLRDDHGRITHLVASAVDVTERVNAQRELLRSSTLLKAIAEQTSDLVYVKDRLGRLILGNPALVREVGKPVEQLIGRTDAEYLDDPAQAGIVMATDQRIMASGRAEAIEEEISIGREARTWLSSKTPYVDDAGEVQGLLGISRDISARKEADEAVRLLARTSEAQRKQLQAIVDGIVQGIIIFNADGSVRTMNPAALALHGFTPVGRRGELQMQSVECRTADGHPLPPAEWPVARSLGGERVRDLELQGRNPRTGREWVALYSSTPIHDASGALESIVMTIQDITERKRTEQELLEADRRKDEFIATLAHELRNPLAPMLSAIQLLQLGGEADVTRQRSKDIIERQVQQMARLIDDLLDISRITLGKLALRREAVDLRSIVDEAIELARPHIVASEHRFRCEMPREAVRLSGDATRLAQVLANLLINAAKYTPRRGEISVSAEFSDGEAAIRVRDSGIGIAPEHLPQLFEKFAQLRPSLNRAGGGLGIGLALAKGLVHMHAGTITASSAGPGRGSEFTIRLPATTVAVAEATPSIARPKTIGPRIGGLRVLVADDNEDAVETAAMLLALDGNEVQVASDGLEAVEVAARYRPDVVLLDIGMPKLNGFEACRRIRSTPWGRDMLVVAVTGWGQEEDRRRTAEAGFDAHFTKPVDFSSVMALIGTRRLEQRVSQSA
jgi:PAS domain S-box-containing protein